MNPNKLKESETIEFKESFKDDALKTLCAFANTSGGSLFLGIKNDSTLLGGKITDKVQQKIVNQIDDLLGIQPEMIVHKEGDGEFLEIKVHKSKTPVDLRGRFYKRVGNTTREIEREGLKALLLKDVPWDSQIRDDSSFEDLDSELIQSVVDKYYSDKSIHSKDHRVFCERLGILNSGMVTNAALILFGKNLLQTFPYIKIRIGRFKNHSTIVSDFEITGNLFEQLIEAESIIKARIENVQQIGGDSFQRHEVWEYPIEAIREAVLNAIVHRNYHITNTEIQIKIYDDFIWIYSPGKLPEEISLEQLKKPHSSIRRNPIIAGVFHRAGYIEQFGTGIERMMEAMKEHLMPEPFFEEQGNGFVVKLYADYLAYHREEQVFDFSKRQKRILEVAQDGPFNMSDLSSVFSNVDNRTLRRDLSELIDADILTAKGEKRGRTYSLKFMGRE